MLLRVWCGRVFVLISSHLLVVCLVSVMFVSLDLTGSVEFYKSLSVEIFKALEKTRLVLSDKKGLQYSRCGRTDKGVSSVGQVEREPRFQLERLQQIQHCPKSCYLPSSRLLQLLTAGLDTTSATLTWALTLLLNNPRTLELAQAEIDEHVGRDRLVEESDVKNLVYLEAIIKETLRLYPAAPLSVPHESIEDCVVGGYYITKGTRLLVNLSRIHRDPNNWSNPNEFQPERFLTSQKDLDVKGNHFELIPFSSGRRMCPGYYLALQELRITLASLIQQYTLKKPSKTPIDVTEGAGITIDKKTPLEVLLAPRLSLNLYDDAGK